MGGGSSKTEGGDSVAAADCFVLNGPEYVVTAIDSMDYYERRCHTCNWWERTSNSARPTMTVANRRAVALVLLFYAR